jgi:hypothetical protein
MAVVSVTAQLPPSFNNPRVHICEISLTINAMEINLSLTIIYA